MERSHVSGLLFVISSTTVNTSYYITFTLRNVHPQHGGGNTEHRQYLINDVNVTLSIYLVGLKRPIQVSED